MGPYGDDRQLVIFIFSYDYANYIDECLNSCLRELGRDAVWVVVETGTTDLTRRMASEFGLANQLNIEYLKFENTPTLKVVSFLSELFHQKYAIFLSADDSLGANYGEQVKSEIDMNYIRPTIVNFQHIVCDENLSPLKIRNPKWSTSIKTNKRNLSKSNPGNTAGVLLPWGVLSYHLSNGKIPAILIEDYWLWWRCVDICDFKNNLEGMVHYRKHSTSTSNASRSHDYAYSLGYVSALPCYMNSNITYRFLGLSLILRWGRHLHYSVWGSFGKGFIESFRERLA